MYLIDFDYFIIDFQIPNLNEPNSDIANQLEIDIDRYSRELLQDCLGFDLFTLLDSNITNGNLNANAPQKFKDLVNGKTYQIDGKNKRWKGLIYTEGLYKSSLLTKYVYYHWLKNKVSHLTGTGEKSIEATNTNSVNSTQRLVNVWNDFLIDYQGQDGCSQRSLNSVFVSSYNGVQFVDFYQNGNTNQFVSLIEFLQDNKTDFEGANLKIFEVKNQLGL